MEDQSAKPVLIVGAGVSGLFLAQHLAESNIPFRIFKRRNDLDTTNVGWCKLKAKSPLTPESQRIRVTRERLRRLLATAIPIEWSKIFTSYNYKAVSITANFEDGTQCTGSILMGCDGTHSKICRLVLPETHDIYRIPVCVMGTRSQFTPVQIESLRKLDPFFSQSTSSQNDTFVYFSMLDAPSNEGVPCYAAQIVVSSPYGIASTGRDGAVEMPNTNTARVKLFSTFAKSWVEPFSSLTLGFPNDIDLKPLALLDWPPPKNFRGHRRVALIGDAFHPMAMYRCDGANHAIMDVQDFAKIVVPRLNAPTSEAFLRAAIDHYEDEVIGRTRPAVFTSRQASLDAHEYDRINAQSLLLSRRVMKLYVEPEQV